MEKAYKLEFTGEKSGSLFVNCCGCSRTESLHSFGPAQKPHYLIHFVLSGRGNFIIKNKEYSLEPGYGFLIPPEELAFYQADEKDPWIYVWVGFSGVLAESTVKAMGLSLVNPIFKSDRADELYQAVKDMMEHNTYGIANDLRRNGQLQLFLSIIAESVPIEKKGEAENADNYVRRAVEFIQGNYCNPIKVTDVADYVCINRSYLYTYSKTEWECRPSSFLPPSALPRQRSFYSLQSFLLKALPCPADIRIL